MGKKVQKRYGSLTGYIPFRGELIYFESQLERDFIIRTLQCQNVVDLKRADPINYKDEIGKKRRYTPDFEVSTREFYRDEHQKHLIEVKMLKDLDKQKDELTPRFDAAKAYCRETGRMFSVWTEEDIQDNFLVNALFLREFLIVDGVQRRFPMPDIFSVEKMLIGRLEDMRITTVRGLLGTVSDDRNEQVKYLPNLWRAIALHQIRTDLTLKLSMVSEIWHPKPDPGGHSLCYDFLS